MAMVIRSAINNHQPGPDDTSGGRLLSIVDVVASVIDVSLVIIVEVLAAVIAVIDIVVESFKTEVVLELVTGSVVVESILFIVSFKLVVSVEFSCVFVSR
jgi:hypothetical protein